MQMKYRTLYHMKSTTEINTLQCLLENQVQKIVSHEKHNKNETHYNVFMKTKNRKIYHMKSITEINTLQCLHETQVWNNVSH